MDMDAIMDLDGIVENWARKELEKDAKSVKALKKRVNNYDNLIYARRDGNITFERQGDTEYRQTQNKLEDKMPNQTVMKSTFKNYTGCQQIHAFKCERSTQVVEKLIMTNGFKMGANIGIQLGVPKVANVTFGFNPELSFGNNAENNQMHSLTWNSDSNVHVPPHEEVIAEFKVTERKFIGTFESKIMISGLMEVDIKDPDSNEIIHTVRENMAKIIELWLASTKGRGSEGQQRNTGYDIELSNGDTTAIWTVRGTCYFRYGVEQTIDTRSKPLTEESTEYASPSFPNNSSDCDNTV
ncbi:uncharacterized protein LOC117335503 [Pecten maximus]|uniref:uncharacterized protein LOC117335503 n=1 Tax=Pecten maximus TaxID=6579 RepID=UPI001457F2FB|nr:uncharacterized protein LOC117335503 [Pecten maximus]